MPIDHTPTIIALGSHTIRIEAVSEGAVLIDLYHDIADSTERATVSVNTVDNLKIIAALAKTNVSALG